MSLSVLLNMKCSTSLFWILAIWLYVGVRYLWWSYFVLIMFVYFLTPEDWLYVGVRYLCLGTSMGTNFSNALAFSSLGNVL